MAVHAFPKGISSKELIARMEFELIYYDVTVQHIGQFSFNLGIRGRGRI